MATEIDASAERWARLTLLVGVTAAIPVLLVLGSDEWFHLDEWFFVADRDLTADGILRDHSGHWVSLPYLVFRGLQKVFGLRSYLPYQLLVVATHAVLVVLVRTVTRRAGVGPWTASGVAAVLLFFGGGEFNILFAFQISVNGSMVLGLVALLLVVGPEPAPRRFVAAAAVAVVGLTTSGVVLPMIVGLGLAVWMTHGFRRAAAVTAPSAFVYFLWFLSFGNTQAGRRGTTAQSVELFSDLTTGVFRAIGGSSVVAALLGAVVVYGLASRCREAWTERTLTALAIPAALVAAWVTFAGLTALTRSASIVVNPGFARSERYMYIGAVLVLPLVGIGASALRDVHRRLALVPVLLLALAVPGNVDLLLDRAPASEGSREVVVALAESDLLDQVEDDVRPAAFNPLTARWLRDVRDEDDLPATDLEPSERLLGDLLLAVTPVPDFEDGGCQPEPAERVMSVVAGDRMIVEGAGLVSAVDGDARSVSIVVSGRVDLLVRAGPIELGIVAADGGPIDVCVLSADTLS